MLFFRNTADQRGGVAMRGLTDNNTVTVEHGGQAIGYVVRACRGRAIKIVVRGPEEVEVRAPAHISAERVHAFVKQQAGWIAGALERQAGKTRLVPRAYRTGEAFYFLGRPLRLEVAHSVWMRVAHDDGVLKVTLDDPSNSRRVKELVWEWYRRQAGLRLSEYLASALERYRAFIRPARCSLGIRSEACPDGVRLTVRAMKTRWGSCSPDGHITLSLELMHVPRRLIEYVIVHELCHLVRLDHSKAYYFQVARCLPDWQQRRRELETRSWCQERGGS